MKARWFVDTWREWGWGHFGLGIVAGSLALFSMGAMLFWADDFPYLRSWIYNVAEFGWPYVFALRVADRAAADGVPRLLAYGAAVVLVIVLGVWVIGPLLSPLIGGDPNWNLSDDISLALSLLLPMTIATVAYAHWRREREVLQRVQAAEVARAEDERRVQSARLLALQARVEPQFLFDTLKRIRGTIDGSAQSAERLLDDLIALLRAMQPAADATTSTVRREFALVQAYARASEAAALQPPRLRLASEGPAARARLAPLLLLPLLRRLAGDAPQARWAVDARTAGTRLVVRVAAEANDPAARVALDALRPAELQSRLRAVHGDDATLAIDTGPAPALALDVALLIDDTDDPADRPPGPDR